MNLKEKFHAQVRDYHDGTLSDLDQKIFESYMDQDPVFAEYVQAYQEIILNRNIVEKAKSSADIPNKEIIHVEVQRRHIQKIENPPTPLYEKPFFIKSLAVFTAIIWLAVLYLNRHYVIDNKQSLSVVEVTERYFEKPNDIAALSVYKDDPYGYAVATSIMEYYKMGDYVEMLKMLNNLSRLEDEICEFAKHKPALVFTKGLCYLFHKDYQRAVEHFEKVDSINKELLLGTHSPTCKSKLADGMESSDKAENVELNYSEDRAFYFQQEAFWYLAYTHLSNNDREKAYYCLNKIKKTSPRYNLAQKVLSELTPKT